MEVTPTISMVLPHLTLEAQLLLGLHFLIQNDRQWEYSFLLGKNQPKVIVCGLTRINHVTV
jgi:hypothetical protein